MLASTVSVLIPVLFVVLLGYGAGRLKEFDADQVAGINELVLDFALPASLFVGIIGISRTTIATSFGFFLVVLAALLATYAVAFAIAKLVVHLSTGAAALFALGAAFPSAPFFGPAVLGGIFGSASALSISTTAIIGNLVLVPVSLVILESERAAKRAQATASRPIRELVAVGAGGAADVVREPVDRPTTVPPQGLLGVSIPQLVDSMLNLIGQTTSGLALFVAGLLLAAHSFRLNGAVTLNSLLKSVVQPALILGWRCCLGYTIRWPARAWLRWRYPPR
jgi:predicted permease